MPATDAVKIYGTDEPRPEVIRLAAGPLSIELEGGAIRYVRYGGHEAIRGIDYLLRDSSWRTPPAKITWVRREETPDRFACELEGVVAQDDIDYRYRLVIEGGADGHLEVRADGEAVTGFLTSRTGFVVLHPIIGVAGKAVTVTHRDGSVEETTFPELISPDQPIFNIRALRHEVAPGLFVTCRMEANLPRDPDTVYEMEDQRNWTDASYKTYVCSLLDPWPFRIEAGDRIAQRVSLSFEGRVPQAASGGSATAIAVRFGDGETGRRLPEIGLGVMPEHRAGAGAAASDSDLGLRPQFITAYAVSDSPELAATLADYAALANALGAAVQLELVLPAGKSPGAELAAAAKACAAAGIAPARVIACPEPYLKSVQPVGPWPEVVDLAHIYNQVRKAFPEAKVLGGMLSYFTELNRKPPPIATVDAVICTTTPIVHAGDDRSVMETLEALPAVVASMAAMARGRPLHIGPSSIGMRHNPYGATTAPNPAQGRIAMAEEDPRQKGLFAAAWSVGYAAAIAATPVATLALNHIAGPHGLFAADNALHPVFHVMKALFLAAGKLAVPVKIEGHGIAALAWRDDDRMQLILANLGAETTMANMPTGLSGRLLDAAAFDDAAADPGWSTEGRGPLPARLELGPYAVLFATA